MGIPKLLLFKPDMKTPLNAEEALAERAVIYDQFGEDRLVQERKFAQVSLENALLWL